MPKHNTKTEGNKRLAARKRNFATIVYPESAPPEWRETLSDAHLAAFISPLHDKDVNPDGTAKKPHYHVLVMYESPQDFDTSVQPLFDKIGGVGREIVGTKRGYARYLCHLDSPEKAQYKPADVIALGGASYSAVIHLPTDDAQMMHDIENFARINQIYSFAELSDIAAEINPDWFSFISCKNTIAIAQYLKSLTWEIDKQYVRKKEEKIPVIVPTTGEVIDLDEIDKID